MMPYFKQVAVPHEVRRVRVHARSDGHNAEKAHRGRCEKTRKCAQMHEMRAAERVSGAADARLG
jgi:hypothetical protein